MRYSDGITFRQALEQRLKTRAGGRKHASYATANEWRPGVWSSPPVCLFSSIAAFGVRTSFRRCLS